MKWRDYFDVFQRIGSRYFIIAGFAFLLFYVVLNRRIFYKKIQQKMPASKDFLREIGYSFITMLLFTFIPVIFIKNPAMRAHTTLYDNISDKGWLWFFIAFPVMFIMHDTYFYFTHRIMHHPKLFKTFHLVHHLSTNPSPWAAYAFHPLEAIVEVGIFMVFIFTIPVMPMHIVLFFLLSIVYNVYGHLGYELYPKNFSRHWLGRWINTSVNHNQHHQYFKGNYGLYFLFWDRMFNTIRPDYDTCFDEVKSR